MTRPRREPKRAPSTYCPTCYGMSWRVQGSRCKCGLRYAPEPGEQIEVWRENRYWQEIEDES